MRSQDTFFPIHTITVSSLNRTWHDFCLWSRWFQNIHVLYEIQRPFVDTDYEQKIKNWIYHWSHKCIISSERNTVLQNYWKQGDVLSEHSQVSRHLALILNNHVGLPKASHTAPQKAPRVHLVKELEVYESLAPPKVSGSRWICL